jgi:hypothetical protein
MDSKSMTRKEFITLTFTLIGSAATVAACGTSGSSPLDSGITGTGGFGGIGGKGGAGGSAGAGGSGGGAGGAGGTPDAGTAACTDPLPEVQDPDLLHHTHTVTVAAATLAATSDQTFTTSVASEAGIPSHTHQVILTRAHLATLAAGGTVDVTALISQGHVHSYTVRCH